MSGPDGAPSSEPDAAGTDAAGTWSGRRRAVVGGAAAVAVVVAAVVLGTSGDDPEPGAEPTTSAPTVEPTTPAPRPSTPEPTEPTEPSGEPTEPTEPTEPAVPDPGPPGAEQPDAGGPPPPVPVPDGGAALPPLGTAPPEVVTLDEPAPVARAAQVRVVGIEEIAAEASGVGEIAGPAMLVTLEVLNAGTAPLALAPFSVTAYLGDDAVPASPVTSDERHSPFTGEVAPGATARGAYVFSLRGDPGGVVSIAVLGGTEEPMVVFQGPRPGSAG